MADQKLVDYINQCKQAGMSNDQIRQALLGVGWNAADINFALSPVDPPSLIRTPAPASQSIPYIAPGQTSYEVPVQQGAPASGPAQIPGLLQKNRTKFCSL